MPQPQRGRLAEETPDGAFPDRSVPIGSASHVPASTEPVTAKYIRLASRVGANQQHPLNVLGPGSSPPAMVETEHGHGVARLLDAEDDASGREGGEV
jgi:hypothetical protein